MVLSLKLKIVQNRASCHRINLDCKRSLRNKEEKQSSKSVLSAHLQHIFVGFSSSGRFCNSDQGTPLFTCSLGALQSGKSSLGPKKVYMVFLYNALLGSAVTIAIRSKTAVRTQPHSKGYLQLDNFWLSLEPLDWFGPKQTKIYPVATGQFHVSQLK